VTTWVCIASGPSLTQDDVDHCRGKARVVVVNDGYRLAPWADALYACDRPWWDLHFNDVRETFQGSWYSHSKPATDQYGAHHVEGVDGEGLCKTPGCVHFGANGGYQVVNLAYHWGARRILLLGYDCQADPYDPERTHWFGQHPGNLERGSPEKFGKWIRRYRALYDDLKAEGVELINCSRQTAINFVPRMPIEEALC